MRPLGNQLQRLLLRNLKGFFSFAFGNIRMRSGHTNGPVGGVTDQDPAGIDPAIDSVFLAQAELDIVAHGSPLKGVGQVGQHSLAIFWVQTGFPFMVGMRNFMIFIAKHRFPPRREIGFVGCEIPIPDPLVGSLNSGLEPLLAFLHCLHHLRMFDGNGHYLVNSLKNPQIGRLRRSRLSVVDRECSEQLAGGTDDRQRPAGL